MKKTVAILLMTTLVFSLVACSVKDTSSKYSSADFSASNTSVLPAIKQEIESAISSSDNSTSTPSRVLSTNSADIVEQHDDKYHLMKLDFDRYFELVKYNHSTLLSGKQTFSDITPTDEVPFYKWVITQNQILLPRIIYDDFEVIYTSIYANSAYGQRIHARGKNGEKFKEFHVVFYPVENIVDLNKDLLTLIKARVDKNLNLTKSTAKNKWGEYYVDKTSPTAYFRYDDYVIKIDLPYLEDGAQFDPAYFNYFDFEYVSLENY